MTDLIHQQTKHRRIDKRSREQRSVEDHVRRVARKNGALAKKTGEVFTLLDLATKAVIADRLSAEQVLDLVTTTTK